MTAYGKTGPVTGPTISGCAVSAAKVTVKFNSSLLASGTMNVQDYFKGIMDPETVSVHPCVLHSPIYLHTGVARCEGGE